MSKPSVLQRLNHHVTSGKGKVLDLSRDAPDEGFSHFAGLPASAMSATIVSHMQYFVNPEGVYDMLCVVCYVVICVLCRTCVLHYAVCVRMLCYVCVYVCISICSMHVCMCTGYGIS